MGPTWILEDLLTNLFDYQLIHLSINIVEYSLLLSKVGIVLGAADNNDFDLETYNYASRRIPFRPQPIGRRCRVTRHSAASPVGRRSRDATDRSGPPKSWQGPVNTLERSPPEADRSDDLPPPNTRRWVVRRKAAVVTAVRTGRITLEEALQRYQLTEEEYRSWERAFEQHGLAGLRTTRVQQYRGPRHPRSRH